ncbi:hypothetical protein [Natronoglomus mannanivorans]|uniref:Uncharacterized protein n=1 Tax=Natronoglomus mannanivorans TaxID=2979990 RepID=A0AAP2Z1V6_9EURY|nr:hypothetical protein [Halobacteria archaeon AArc-xg1-1]
MEIERRKLLALVTVGLFTTSWKVGSPLQWAPETDPENAYSGGYGSVSTGSNPLSVRDGNPTNGPGSLIPELLNETGSVTRIELEVDRTLEIETEDTVNESSPEADSQEESELDSPSFGGGTEDDTENTVAPGPELPDSGYGIDPYGSPQSNRE